MVCSCVAVAEMIIVYNANVFSGMSENISYCKLMK